MLNVYNNSNFKRLPGGVIKKSHRTKCLRYSKGSYKNIFANVNIFFFIFLQMAEQKCYLRYLFFLFDWKIEFYKYFWRKNEHYSFHWNAFSHFYKYITIFVHIPYTIFCQSCMITNLNWIDIWSKYNLCVFSVLCFFKLTFASFCLP